MNEGVLACGHRIDNALPLTFFSLGFGWGSLAWWNCWWCVKSILISFVFGTVSNIFWERSRCSETFLAHSPQKLPHIWTPIHSEYQHFTHTTCRPACGRHCPSYTKPFSAFSQITLILFEFSFQEMYFLDKKYNMAYQCLSMMNLWIFFSEKNEISGSLYYLETFVQKYSVYCIIIPETPILCTPMTQPTNAITLQIEGDD